MFAESLADDEVVVVLPAAAVQALPPVAARTLFNPDTLYLFSHIFWKMSEAKALLAAMGSVRSTRGRSLSGRIEGWIAQMDPLEEARVRALTHADLMTELRDFERENGLSGGDESTEQVPITIAGRDFVLVPWSPKRGMTFKLLGPDITIHGRLGAPKPLSPNIWLEIGSAPFWTNPWMVYLEGWTAWLRAVALEKPEWEISRLDMAFHTQALGTSDLDRKNFVCRAETNSKTLNAKMLADLKKAHERDTYARRTGQTDVCIEQLIAKLEEETGLVHVDFFHGEIPQMVTFGRRSWMYARVYNKSREISRKAAKMALFHGVWQENDFDMDRDVINVEFEITRKWLKSREFVMSGQHISILTVSDLIQHHEKLAAYLLGNGSHQEGWLRMIIPDKTRRERCTTAEAWALVRQAAKVLPEITIAATQAVAVKCSAAELLPGAVRLKARLDEISGRSVPDEELTVDTMLASIAEVIAGEYQRKDTSAWSSKRLLQTYRAERIKVRPVTGSMPAKDAFYEAMRLQVAV